MRKWVGYSATELAQATGYSKTIMSRWENGKKPITKESDRLLRLVIFAKMLEISVGEKISIDGKSLPDKVGEVARLVKSLNLAEFLNKIENKHEGSLPIRIDTSSPICAAVQ